mmetsp:Transcript_62841/g.144021  ORF Transcript_62841/g.144021 Transcript_62841/m.144021 type:complete len:222 (+) Transcript_62841:703-1368(+)
MLITHPHIPAAAPDLFRIEATLKDSFLRRFFSIHSHAITGALSLSKLMRRFRNWSTLPMSFFAAPQDTSFGILPAPINTMTPAVTSSTPAGGEARAFSSVMLFLSRELSASIAAWMTGSAAAISFSHSAWNSVTSSAIFVHFSSSTRARAFCSSATDVSCPTKARSLSVAAFLSSTTSMSFTRFSCSSATCSAALCIFSRPFSNRSFNTRISSRLDASMVL